VVATAASDGLAIEDRATLAALDRYRRYTWVLLAAGLALLAAIVVVNATAHHQHAGWIAVFTVVAGCCVVCAAVSVPVMLRRARRWRSLLSEQPWRESHARYLESIGEVEQAGLVLTDEDPPVVVRLAWSLRSGVLRNQSTVWFCGDPRSHVVITPSRRRILLAASPPRGLHGRLWMWTRRKELERLGVR